MTAAKTSDPQLARIVEMFETLRPENVSKLDEFYTADAYFKDPFNELRGLPGVKAVFEHMFVALNEPCFIVRDVVRQGEQCFMTWDFVFRFKRFSAEQQTVRGATHFRINDEGKIAWHRDYWDVAEELYEKLPLIGGLMRWLKQRATH